MKTKIVHIISNLSIGGAQLLLFDILKTLQSETNYDITLITIDSGFYKEKFTSAGINVIDIYSKGLVNPLIYLRLKKFLSALKPHIVHTHLLKADFYGRLAAKRLGIKHIFSTCHNDSTVHITSVFSGEVIFNKIDNWVLKYSNSKIVAISQNVKQYLLNRLDKNLHSRIKVIYNGIDIKKEEYILNDEEIKYFRNNLGFKVNDFVISVIGRLEEQKGHLPFLKSIIKLIPKFNLRIIFVGEGSKRKEIEKYVKEYNLEENVILTGFQSQPEKFFEISDLVIVPSLWEGFGIVVCEAMIKNKIILASNVGGIPEIIDDGITGFLYNLNDEKQMREKLEFIIKNFSELKNITSAAKKKVKEKFDIMKNSLNYSDYYKDTLNKL